MAFVFFFARSGLGSLLKLVGVFGQEVVEAQERPWPIEAQSTPLWTNISSLTAREDVVR